MVRHLLFYNLPPPLEIDGIATAELGKKMAIQEILLNIKTKLPADYYYAVTTQFYLVDLIEQLADLQQNRVVDQEDIFLIFDSDCIFHRPIPPALVQYVQRVGCMPYATANLEDVNLYRGIGTRFYGYSLLELQQLARDYGTVPGQQYYYTGGEILAFSGKELPRIAAEARRVLEISIERHLQGRPKFNTEEQFFGYIFSKFGFPPYEGRKYIRRMYTGQNYTDINPATDNNLVIWHLLIEKVGLFDRYFKKLANAAFWDRGAQNPPWEISLENLQLD